jgi:signal transduction histidine kinase
VTASELPAAGAEGESARVAAARSRAVDRLRRQRETLRPLGLALLAVVAVSVFGGTPKPSLHGEGLGVTLALVAFAATFLVAVRPRAWSLAAEAVLVIVMGAAAVALAALQPHGVTSLAGGAAIWMAVARLPLRPAVVIGAAITIGLDAAIAARGGSAAAVLATTLLCALLGLVAHFLRRSRAGEEQTELLLAELEDAREQQLEAAAIAERGRIAGELHDVLAHSLSGAAIQLQGARRLAERDGAGGELRAAVDRASELVKDGLADAREAVGALRGEELPGVAQLGALVESFRDDLHLDVTLAVEGSTRPLPADGNLALYRGAQEALTNAARYAPADRTRVVVRYEPGRTTLSVENRSAVAAPVAAGLPDVGGGRGLTGMRERLERAGGSARAGPTPDGWLVELELPA